jgi:hypothetical protein
LKLYSGFRDCWMGKRTSGDCHKLDLWRWCSTHKGKKVLWFHGGKQIGPVAHPSKRTRKCNANFASSLLLLLVIPATHTFAEPVTLSDSNSVTYL